MNNQLKRVLRISLPIMTGVFITLFLSGKVVAIPHGTHEGGIIGATGVAIILVAMSVISIILAKILPSLENQAN